MDLNTSTVFSNLNTLRKTLWFKLHFSEELKKEASATPSQMEKEDNTDRIRQLEVMVSELRRESDDLQQTPQFWL